MLGVAVGITVGIFTIGIVAGRVILRHAMLQEVKLEQRELPDSLTEVHGRVRNDDPEDEWPEDAEDDYGYPEEPQPTEEQQPSPPVKIEPSRKEELWRWLALTVGGTVLPFAVLAVAYRLAAGHFPSPQAVLGRGELFIPASIVNAEAIWILRYVTLPGKSVWFPIIFATCGLAALGGAICYGVTAALETAPHNRVHVTQTALQQLAMTVTVLSAGEFVMAFLVGTIGVVLFMLARGQEVPVHE